MKHAGEHAGRWGEGGLLAAALALVLALSLWAGVNRRPRWETVPPIHSALLLADAGAAETGAQAAPLDLNAATAAELAALPGIGDVLAARIVAYSAANGGFAEVDELTAVEGIGEKKCAALRAWVCVGEAAAD